MLVLTLVCDTNNKDERMQGKQEIMTQEHKNLRGSICVTCVSIPWGGGTHQSTIINKDHKHSDLLSIGLCFSAFLSPKTS